MEALRSRIPELLGRHESSLLAEWISLQLGAKTLRADLISEADLR
jgi:hypothetical protein